MTCRGCCLCTLTLAGIGKNICNASVFHMLHAFGGALLEECAIFSFDRLTLHTPGLQTLKSSVKHNVLHRPRKRCTYLCVPSSCTSTCGA